MPFRFAGVRVVGRSLLRRAAPPVIGLGLAAGLVVAVEKQPASGAFTATTADGGNTVTTATTFCTTPGSVELGATADTTINQGAANVAASATDIRVRVTSRTGSPNPPNIRGLVRFALPAIPARCSLASARLKLYNVLPVAGRTIDVHLVDPAAPLWTEGVVTWNTRPGVVAGTAVGAPSPATEAYMEWDVTSRLPSLFTANNGFMVQDRNEGDPVGVEQSFVSSNTSTGPYALKLPVLVVSWN